MVEQIKLFVDQANAALKEGDIQRSHNLAMKAHGGHDDREAKFRVVLTI